MLPRLKAMALLALALLRTLLRRALPERRTGLQQFRDNYRADGLGALSPGQRRVMEGFTGCVACGRCNRGDEELSRVARGRFPGTMALILAAPRSLPEYRAAAPGFRLIGEARLRQKQRWCPTGVPLAAIGEFVCAMADQGRDSRRPSSLRS